MAASFSLFLQLESLPPRCLRTCLGRFFFMMSNIFLRLSYPLLQDLSQRATVDLIYQIDGLSFTVDKVAFRVPFVRSTSREKIFTLLRHLLNIFLLFL